MILANIVDNIIDDIEILNIKSNIVPSTLLSNISVIKIRIYEAKIPKTIPKGIPINPKYQASFITTFLICLGVAPILANIPKVLVFSETDILKEFFIQNTEVIIIINAITEANPYIIVLVLSPTAYPAHLKYSRL